MNLIEELGVPNVVGRSLFIDYGNLHDEKPLLAEALTRNAEAFHNAEFEMQPSLRSKWGEGMYRIRLTNLPTVTPISQLSEGSFEWRIVQFKGIVTGVQPVKKGTSYRRYECRMKNGEKEYRADTIDEILNPVRMPKSTILYTFCKECRKFGRDKVPYDLVSSETIFVPYRRLVVQENISEVGSGRIPTKIVGYVMDDLTASTVTQGEQILCTAIVYPDFKGGVFTEIIYFTKLNATTEVTVTMNDEAEIVKLAHESDIYDKLIASYCPVVLGYEDIKLGLLCSLVGAPRVDNVNEAGVTVGTKTRGDVTVLLVGDAGLAKSLMLNQAGLLSPRPVYASGGRATEAGLTGSWSKGKDDIPELKAGAMILADDGGIVIIDEFEKLKESDRLSLHKPMEDQFFPITMAGLTEYYNTRCPVVAACNPKSGRFDPNKTLLENINFDEPTLSRFDLIFKMRDLPKKDTEMLLSKHMLRSHSKINEGPISLPDLRKYIAYCKRITPLLEDEGEAFNLLHEGYMEARFDESEGQVRATPRVQQSLIRVAKALARMTLSGTVERRHAELALKLFKSSTAIHSLDTDLRQFNTSIKGYVLEQVSKGKLVKLDLGRMFPDMEAEINGTVNLLLMEGKIKDEGLFWVKGNV